MRWARAAALAIPALAFLAVVLAGPHTPGEGAQEQGIVITPVLRIYKDGVLVYEKTGDPPTHNLAMLWLWVIGPAVDTSGNNVVFTVTKLNGQALGLDPDGDYYTVHTLWGIVGTGTNPPAYTDYNMQAVAAGRAKLVSLYYDENQTAWHMVVSAAVTVDSALNITEVGLAADIPSSYVNNPITDPEDNVLVFRDILPQPIVADAGDVIEIQYEIVIDFP